MGRQIPGREAEQSERELGYFVIFPKGKRKITNERNKRTCSRMGTGKPVRAV